MVQGIGSSGRGSDIITGSVFGVRSLRELELLSDQSGNFVLNWKDVAKVVSNRCENTKGITEVKNHWGSGWRQQEWAHLLW